MSGGQRKRVTFADLVTARLPSAVPQQPPVSSSAETGVSPNPEPLTTAHEITESPDVVPPSTQRGGSEDVGQAKSPGTNIHTAPTLKSILETTPEEKSVSQPPDGSQPYGDSQPLGDSQSLNVSQPVGDSQPPEDSLSSAVRRTFRPAGASQNDSQTAEDSQSPSDSQPPSDRHPLKEVKGYLKLANTIVDSLLPTLDVYEQAVFVQLYRLSHGFGNFTCKVSLPALQARTGVKPTSLKQAIARLQTRGVVEKISAEIGFGREQGITYWVSPDGRQTYGDWQAQGGSQSLGDDNKRKEYLKETKSKGKLAPEQIKDCPDCHGVGMWYPEGVGRGVARCYHPSLRK
jgi:hypothetical protein